MYHEVNHEVQQEGDEDEQLDAGDGVSDDGQEVVRSLHFILTIGGAKGLHSVHGVLVEHVDDEVHDESAHNGDHAEELGC